jgi:hypothetical protein
MSLEEKIDQLTSEVLDMKAACSRCDDSQDRKSPDRKNRGRQSRTDQVRPESASQSPAVELELEIMKERLRVLEEVHDRRRPVARIPNPTLEELWDRIDEVELNSARLAEDALGTVQGLHEELSALKSTLQEESRRQSEASEKRLHHMLTEATEKIAMVLRKLVAVQRSNARLTSCENRSVSKEERRRMTDELQREISLIQRL